MDMLMNLAQGAAFVMAAVGAVVAGSKLLPAAEDFFCEMFSSADAE